MKKKTENGNAGEKFTLSASLKSKAYNGFTLIELLLVISIIAILVGMLLPVLNKAKGKAKESSCTNILKQMSLSTFMYASDYYDYMPQATTADIKYAPQWCRQLAAYMGVRDPSATAGNNADIADLQKKPLFVCPAEDKLDTVAGWGITNYAYSVWAGNYVPEIPLFRVSKLYQIPDPAKKIYIMDAPGSFGTSINAGYTWGYYKFTSSHLNSLSLAVQLAPPRHNYGTCLLYVDGHADWRKRGNIAAQEFNVLGDGTP